MRKQLTHVNVWVHDQDEALAFYTEIGWSFATTVTVAELGNFRWLTVGVRARTTSRSPHGRARPARLRRGDAQPGARHHGRARCRAASSSPPRDIHGTY